MKKILLIIALAVSMANANAAVLHNAYSRQATSLNGDWQIIVDPFDAGYYDYRMAESPYGFFKNAQPQSGYDHVEYDFVADDRKLAFSILRDFYLSK